MTERRRQPGFTLVEMIMTIVVTGIIAGIVAVFMAAPIRGYFDTVRRAAMSDVADGALRRIGFELRGAVPNTLRVAGGNRFLEFIPAKDGGRYRVALTAAGTGDILDGTSDTDTAFDVLGPPVGGSAGDFVVVFNTGQAGADAYVGANRRTLSAAAGATVSFAALAGSPFPPYESPTRRFQVVAAGGPVSFACTGVGSASGSGTGELRRYAGYGFNAAQPTAGLGVGALLADRVSACRFDYTSLSAANGLLVLQLTVSRDGESIPLHHEIHVDNTP